MSATSRPWRRINDFVYCSFVPKNPSYDNGIPQEINEYGFYVMSQADGDKSTTAEKMAEEIQSTLNARDLALRLAEAVLAPTGDPQTLTGKELRELAREFQRIAGVTP